MMKQGALLLFSVAFLITPVGAQNSSTTAFKFLNYSFDAASMAMGGVSVAVPDGAYGIVTNPAAAGFISKRQVMTGYRSMPIDVWGGLLGCALPYKNYGTFAIDLLYVNSGTVSEVLEVDGRPFSTGVLWKAYSIAGDITWSKIVWETLAFGGSLRVIHDLIGSSQDHYTADAIAFQAGLQYRLLGSEVVAGLALNNAGFMISGYSSETSDLKLPLSLTAGICYSPYYIPNLRVALDLKQPGDGYLEYKLGGELGIYKRYFIVRAGYTWSEQDLEAQFKVLKGEADENYQKANFYGLSLGVGANADISKYNVGVDIGFQLVDDMDPVYGVSLLVGF
jgi:hypothetical protein